MSFNQTPSFFVIGAQRAGTTRLCHLLNRHPQVVIPTKEPFYFQSSEAMQAKQDWYRSLFESAEHGSIFGEGSTCYSMCDAYPGTARRIHEFNPDARIIYMVRHPLRRIESAWYQLLFTRELSGLRSFKTAVLASDALIEPTLYSKQLAAYREYFPDQQIHVEVFENFALDESSVTRRCWDFLGVEDYRSTLDDSTAARNDSASKLQPWLILDLLKALPGYPRFKHLVPDPVRAAVGERLQKRIRRVPEWDEELLGYVTERVQDDCHALLAHLALPSSLWDLRSVRFSKRSGDRVGATPRVDKRDTAET